MAHYDTRGQKHDNRRMNYDSKFNKGYAWHTLFDIIVAKLLSFSDRVEFNTTHFQQLENLSNRDYELSEITPEALRAGEVVEIEAEWNTYRDIDFRAIRKAVIRLQPRNGQQVVVVVDFSRNNLFIKTAYLNYVTDNHQSGLDTTFMDYDYIGYFGYIWGGTSVVYEIPDYGKEYTQIS